MQTAIPCTIMRGGTSRGPYFLSNHLPRDWETQEKILLAAMGSSTGKQIDGIGGATSLTSKAAIISVSDHPDADIDYLFIQVSIEDMSVDIAPSCGNILAGVGPFSIESGLIKAQDGETVVRVRNLNTNSFIEATVQTPEGFVQYDGETRIDGVEGTAAPVVLKFLDVAGTKTGRLFPTGNIKDSFDGVTVSCVDAAMPMVLIPADELGIDGAEPKEVLDSNTDLLSRIESIRLQAGAAMGLGDVSGMVIPKVGVLSQPRKGGSITSRYFVPDTCHASHAATGAICVSVATRIPGTVANDIAKPHSQLSEKITIEHPSGQIEIVLDIEADGETYKVHKAGVIRTARRIFRGEIYIPDTVWTADK
ncbi:4-oxalomesaconate tautomerase [Grimontia celer]|uniref:4-oxalomesaconate tautomerase n=1 Tax=Grimontia celer TaxID=1796497 RepID=A0A128EX73_9GAMM|nr:4-oxalomesaconate tautomerase [Grimontia celer]CZF79189.1 4-oxalomesaconate tautomerase [Grimontia celer]